MKKICFVCFLFCSVSYTQIKGDYSLGKVTKDELLMNRYDEDPDAGAVVLEEKGKISIGDTNPLIFHKEYYIRIKVFKRSAFHLATRYLRHHKKLPVQDLEALSYNLDENGNIVQSNLTETKIYNDKLIGDINATSFQIPNVKEGTVFELKYTFRSYGYEVYDWNFQSEYPKLISKYTAFATIYPSYNIKINGYLKPDISNLDLSKCASVNENCNEINYEMKNVPAFKKDAYMTSENNFKSRIVFEKSYRTPIDRIIQLNFIPKTRYKKYFRSKLPDFIKKEADILLKARKVYRFIQSHYTWNKFGDLSNEVNLKKAFFERKGSVGEVNLALLNALLSLKIDAKIALLSTRENGKIANIHPSLLDFNYMVIRIKVDGKVYFLDATNKHLEFGVVPFRCLNGKARVFSLKQPSFWEDVKSNVSTEEKSTSRIVFNPEENLFKGISRIQKYGYRALSLREQLDSNSEKDYIMDQSSKLNRIEVEDYKIKNVAQVQKPIQETVTFVIEPSLPSEDSFSIDPFLFTRIDKNPFTLKERMYPIDYGTKEKSTHLVQINIPKGYKVVSIPENAAFTIREKELFYYFQIVHGPHMIQIKSVFEINKPVFSASNYEAIKKFYDKIIESQKNQIIIQKK